MDPLFLTLQLQHIFIQIITNIFEEDDDDVITTIIGDLYLNFLLDFILRLLIFSSFYHSFFRCQGFGDFIFLFCHNFLHICFRDEIEPNAFEWNIKHNRKMDENTSRKGNKKIIINDWKLTDWVWVFRFIGISFWFHQSTFVVFFDAKSHFNNIDGTTICVYVRGCHSQWCWENIKANDKKNVENQITFIMTTRWK